MFETGDLMKRFSLKPFLYCLKLEVYQKNIILMRYMVNMKDAWSAICNQIGC